MHPGELRREWELQQGDVLALSRHGMGPKAASRRRKGVEASCWWCSFKLHLDLY